MKLFWLVSSAFGLSEDEIASFRCNGAAAQFHKTQQSGSQQVNVEASSSNNWNGCIGASSCYKTQWKCSVDILNIGGNTLEFTSNSIADHNAWAISNNAIVEQNFKIQFPNNPEMLPISEAYSQPVKDTDIGFAINGVMLQNPYHMNTCCDATLDRAPNTDACNGDTRKSGGGSYGYQFWGNAGKGYDGCAMACDDGQASGIAGVARDGFAIYGPMQYYSASQKKIFKNKSNCGDCELIQLNVDHTDKCGGIEVGDGDWSNGGQYRYIATAGFPSYLQCYRGNIYDTRLQDYVNGRWESFSKIYIGAGKCEINDFGFNEECFIVDQSYAEGQLCAEGNCWIRGTDLSHVYFSCGASKRRDPEGCGATLTTKDPSTFSTQNTARPTKGTKGTKGTQGTKGPKTDGTDNTRPTKGTKGTQGTDGTRPTKATKGTKGPKTDGTDNTRPTKGTKGTQGTDGTRPTKGTKGTDGTRPTKGTKGTDGTRPTKGTKGTRPTQSSQGTDGTDGTQQTRPTIDPSDAQWNGEWTDNLLNIFRCRPGDFWNKPTSCTTDNCKEYLDCSVSVTMNGGQWGMTSNGVPDHNACHDIMARGYRANFPARPQRRSGDPSSWPPTNLGVIGYSLNGVPFFSGYDSKCCDAGLYELAGLDMCYAHPARQGNYHYHLYNECILPCTGLSQIMGVALDGFPIMGPGINPATQMPWCQSDMDICGGREDENGNYAYYMTPDWPYSLQCYAGTPIDNVDLNNNCGFDGEKCNWSPRPGTSRYFPEVGRRGKRSTEDPTAKWFAKALALYNERGQHGSYFQGLFGEAHNRKRRADESAMEKYVQAFLDKNSNVDRPPWGDMTVEDFMGHLQYDCDPCLGTRQLSDTCSGVRHNTCTGETCEKCPSIGADPNCVDNCSFEWKSTTQDPNSKTTERPTSITITHTSVTQSTDGTRPTQSTDGTMPTKSTKGTDGTRPTKGTKGTDGTRPTKGTKGTDGTRPTKGTKGTDGTMPTKSTKGTDGTRPTKETKGTVGPTTDKTTPTKATTEKTTKPTKTTNPGPKDDKCDPANLPEGVVIVDEGKGKNADGTWGADGYMSASCSDGFVDSMNKPKVKHTCKCNADGCMFVPAKAEWKCIDQSICPLPFWGGNKFSYVKFVEDEWSMLKARFKPDPDFETTKFWKTADWTAVVVCNQDLRKDDGSADGVMALEMYPRSHSADGRAWTLVNRPGFYITKRDKGSYYKIMIDSPQEKFPWTVGKTGQKTCWIGVLHGHWPNLAECLGENYANNGLRCSSCW